MNLFRIFSKKRNVEEAKHPESAKHNETTFSRIAEVAHGDKDAGVRAEAQSGVKELFPGGVEGFEEVVYKFIDGLRDTNDVEKRNLASVALVSLGEMAIPYVTPLLEDGDPEVRRLAVRILVMIEQDQKEITGPRP